MSRCLVTLGALALLTQHGCLGDLGERCQLDSDCGGGLVCGESGTCETFASVQASFDVAPSSDSDAGTCSPQIISDG